MPTCVGLRLDWMIDGSVVEEGRHVNRTDGRMDAVRSCQEWADLMIESCGTGRLDGQTDRETGETGCKCKEATTTIHQSAGRSDHLQ